MKIYQYTPPFKTVDFHDNEVQVPFDMKYIVADKDGCIVSFINDPIPDPCYATTDEEGVCWIDPLAGELYIVGYANLEGMEWKESKVTL